MAATLNKRAAASRLRESQRYGGNWRLKGLLLAASDIVDARVVGQAWPRQRPQTQRDYVNLGWRHGDTNEHALARELYSEDNIRNGELVPRDEYISRALIAEAEREKDVLWREELLASVVSGAAVRKIARSTTTVTPVDAKRGDLPTPGHEQFANTGAEGANPNFDEGDYSQTAYTCEPHEEGFALTEELIDHARVDLLEREIRRAGMAVENAINRQYVTNAIDNAGQDEGSVGNEASVQTILEAAENVADNDFDPVDVTVVHPELLTELADDPALNYLNFTRLDRAEDGDRNLQEGDTPPQSPQAFGPRIWVASDATYNGLSTEGLNTSNTYGWESGSEIGGFVHGQPYVHTVIYRDIEVTELSPPFTSIHDIQGGVARAYTDSVQPSNNAISTITQ